MPWEPHRFQIGFNSFKLSEYFTYSWAGISQFPQPTCIRQRTCPGWNWVHPSYMSDGILYWLSFPFSKQEATKSTGLSPAVNLSGLQPGLSRQSLLNGQKSFPGSRADLVLFRSFISQFMPNLCTNERGSKPSLLCSLACLNTFLWSSSFVFSLNIWHSTLIRSWTGAQ